MKKKLIISLVAFLTSLSVCVSTTLNKSYAMWPKCDGLNKDAQDEKEEAFVTNLVEKFGIFAVVGVDLYFCPWKFAKADIAVSCLDSVASFFKVPIKCPFGKCEV